MNAELHNIWSRVQSELALAVDEAAHRIWLEPLTVRDLAHGRLSIEAAPEACSWVRNRYGRLLRMCAEHVLGEQVAIELIPRMGAPEAPVGPGDVVRGDGRGELSALGRDLDPGSPAPHAAPEPRIALANPKLTFDQFVIGDCNRLAHAAALTVAEMPGCAYNPLFICGPPGVGKTHLLSSIASLLIAHNPGLTVHSTTGEGFTNEFMSALAGKRTEAFKVRHRHVDVLLVDDVQFLQRKARTEEEFFHTFNSLYDSGRQIVLTSDRPPRDLQALEDRLRERFESGLVADIAPPDHATRMTILRKRANHDRLELEDEEPLELIAARVTDNVRAIEGALIRVVAFSSLTGRPLTTGLTREVLDGLYPVADSSTVSRGHSPDGIRRGTPPSIDDIAAATCERYGLTLTELTSSSRSPRVAWPRQVAMYLARELTDQSLPAIGRQFGGRDHTTVLYACRRAASRIASDASTRQVVDDLLTTLRPTPPAPAAATTTDRPERLSTPSSPTTPQAVPASHRG